MEIKNQLVQCPKGHYYNPQIHASCPVCAQEAGNQGSFPPTEAPGAAGGNQGSFPPTEAPGSAGGPVGASGGGMNGVTEAPGFSGNAGWQGGVQEANGNLGVFAPTMIGGDINSTDSQTAPVVGWLVCIDGAMRGIDFRIHAGYNYIGRETGDIHISGDQQISRQNHAMVAYDETDMVFFAGPSSGRNLVKVNGKTVFNAVEIHNYDVISIGTTKLMFVGLCGAHFDWRKD